MNTPVLPVDEGDVVDTVPSPLCLYQTTCERRGRAVLGPVEVGEDYENRSIRCVTCGRTGVESVNTGDRTPGRFLKIDGMGSDVANS